LNALKFEVKTYQAFCGSGDRFTRKMAIKTDGERVY